MYYPKEEQIKRAGPTPGMFYWPTRALNVAEIARVAAKNSPTPISTANMVVLIASSNWNHHIRYSTRGYTAYGIEGPQMEAKYSATNYTAGYGSGTSWPMLWIPTPDGKEPEDVYGSPGVGISPITPGPTDSGSRVRTSPGMPSKPGTGVDPGYKPGTGVAPGSRPILDSGGAAASRPATSKYGGGQVTTAGMGGGSGLLLLLLLGGAGVVGWMYLRGNTRKRRRKRKRR